MNAALKELLEQMHNELAQQLLAKLQSGEATAADLNVARQFLKDNEVSASTPASQPMAKLAQLVPFKDPEAPITQAGGQ